jgi:hypothetical protein
MKSLIGRLSRSCTTGCRRTRLVDAGQLDDALAATRTRVGEKSDAAHRAAWEGLHATAVDMAGKRAVLISFPTALHPSEAHLALVLPEQWRVAIFDS